MTVSKTPGSLLQHEAFAGLSQLGQERLEAGAQLLRFRIGQSLLDDNLIPQTVLLMQQGVARLLGREQQTLVTLAKLGPGAFVGLASLLRAQGCTTPHWMRSIRPFFRPLRSPGSITDCRPTPWRARSSQSTSAIASPW